MLKADEGLRGFLLQIIRQPGSFFMNTSQTVENDDENQQEQSFIETDLLSKLCNGKYLLHVALNWRLYDLIPVLIHHPAVEINAVNNVAMPYCQC